jgi:coproporphyrinogen III oxidase
MEWRKRTEGFFRALQDRICNGLEEVDGTTFREDLWARDGGGGGCTRVIEEGGVFEKAGVNFSSVSGNLRQNLRQRFLAATGPNFLQRHFSRASSAQPDDPTVHANFRYLEKGDAAWFGGGADLTPYYPNEEDAVHFHQTLKNACDRHDPEHYSKFKKWCDEYFFLKHRNETRGIGGLFFDYLEGEREKNFAFVSEMGDAFLPPIFRFCCDAEMNRTRNTSVNISCTAAGGMSN